MQLLGKECHRSGPGPGPGSLAVEMEGWTGSNSLAAAGLVPVVLEVPVAVPGARWLVKEQPGFRIRLAEVVC